MRKAREPGRAGLTLLEVMITAALLVVALVGLLNTLVRADRLAATNREMAIATEAARRASARLEGQPFSQVFRLFNADPLDDPGFAGSGPGQNFAIEGLPPRPEDPDGVTGQFVFPGNGGVLREDAVDDKLGMPRDLNGDGFVDALDHGDDYVTLPVTVRVQWRGTGGNRTLDMHLLLAQ